MQINISSEEGIVDKLLVNKSNCELTKKRALRVNRVFFYRLNHSTYFHVSKFSHPPFRISDHYQEKRFEAIAVNKAEFNLQLSNMLVAMKTLISARTLQYKIAIVVDDNVPML